MISNPKVSVVILAYNVSSFIEKCINSVLNQSLQAIEVIIINDGSKDDTFQKIQHFHDERVTIINKENGGVSSARNEGIKRAIGEYIFQLDGDDWIEEDVLNEMYVKAKERNSDILISTKYVEDYQTTSITKFIDTNCLQGDIIADILLENVLGYAWLKLYKNSIFKEHKITYPINISYKEDIIADLYVCYYCKNIDFYDNHSNVHYVQRKGSISKYKTEKTIQDHETFIRLVWNFFKEKGIDIQYRNELDYLEFMQYIYAVINSPIFPSQHREFYEKMNRKMDYLLHNSNYVNNQFNKLALRTQFGYYTYKINYHLGVFIKRIYLIMVRKKDSDVITQ